MSTAAELETALVVSVAQIVGGEARCYCGKDAVLLVTTEPDGEPGPSCFEHAWEWIELSTGLVQQAFGPKGT